MSHVELGHSTGAKSNIRSGSRWAVKPGEGLQAALHSEAQSPGGYAVICIQMTFYKIQVPAFPPPRPIKCFTF